MRSKVPCSGSCEVAASQLRPRADRCCRAATKCQLLLDIVCQYLEAAIAVCQRYENRRQRNIEMGTVFMKFLKSIAYLDFSATWQRAVTVQDLLQRNKSVWGQSRQRLLTASRLYSDSEHVPFPSLREVATSKNSLRFVIGIWHLPHLEICSDIL